jgi:hypothetical protein
VDAPPELCSKAFFPIPLWGSVFDGDVPVALRGAPATEMVRTDYSPLAVSGDTETEFVSNMADLRAGRADTISIDGVEIASWKHIKSFDPFVLRPDER